MLLNSLALAENLNQQGRQQPPAEMEYVEGARKRAFRKKMTKPILERFMEKVVVMDSGCWEWTGKKGRFGHGRFAIRDREFAAHRVAYTILVGDIADGLVLDHQCNNSACVNPAHMKPMTQGDNVRRSEKTFQGINAAKTMCVRGHPLSGDNLKIDCRGRRVCRACRQLLRRAKKP